MQFSSDQGVPTAGGREAEILDHALDLVRESGLSGLTMKKVADRVGFTEAAAYRYFPTKQALIERLVDRLGTQLLDGVRAISAESRWPAADRLERIVSRHVDFILRTNGLPILVLAEAAATGNDRLLARMRAGVDAYLDVLESLLPPGTGPEEVRPHEKALLLFGLTAVLAIRRRLGGDPEAERRVPAELLPFVIRCLTGDPEADPPAAEGGGT